MQKQKPLRTIDILISVLLFLNSLVIFIKFGPDAIGQIFFNVILSLLLITMSFTKDPEDALKSQSLTLFYTTRIFIFSLFAILSLLFTYNIFETIRSSFFR